MARSDFPRVNRVAGLKNGLRRTNSSRLRSGSDTFCRSVNVVHDEAGAISCYDQSSNPPVRRKMAYVGHEQDSGTLKYRCPARHQGWNCPNDARCNEGKSYGLIVRVKSELDLRRFPPIPRATKKFEEMYKGRTASERVNARMKIFWGVDDGNVTGARRFHAYVGVVMVICVALATLLAKTPRREGSLGDTRLSPIALAFLDCLDELGFRF